MTQGDDRYHTPYGETIRVGNPAFGIANKDNAASDQGSGTKGHFRPVGIDSANGHKKNHIENTSSHAVTKLKRHCVWMGYHEMTDILIQVFYSQSNQQRLNN